MNRRNVRRPLGGDAQDTPNKRSNKQDRSRWLFWAGASAWSRPSSAGGGKKNRRVMAKGAPTEAAGRKPRCPSTRTRFGGRLVSALIAPRPSRPGLGSLPPPAARTPRRRIRGMSRSYARQRNCTAGARRAPSPARADDRTLSSRPANLRPRRRSPWWPRVPSPHGGMRDSAPCHTQALTTRAVRDAATVPSRVVPTTETSQGGRK